MRFAYEEQPQPDGHRAGVRASAPTSSATSPVCLILGDNIFYGHDLTDDAASSPAKLTSGARVFAYQVKDPERYGVVEFDDSGKALSIEEKPKRPKSNWAVTGLYFYDASVVDIARTSSPPPAASSRSPTSTARTSSAATLQVAVLGRGIAWLDTRDVRLAAGRRPVRPDAGAAAGAEGRVHRGDRLPEGFIDAAQLQSSRGGIQRVSTAIICCRC